MSFRSFFNELLLDDMYRVLVIGVIPVAIADFTNIARLLMPGPSNDSVDNLLGRQACRHQTTR